MLKNRPLALVQKHRQPWMMLDCHKLVKGHLLCTQHAQPSTPGLKEYFSTPTSSAAIKSQQRDTTLWLMLVKVKGIEPPESFWINAASSLCLS